MPRKTDSNNPADWVFLAESDLEGIRHLAEKEISYFLCHSKLAEILEKVLKAELIRTGWFLLKTHDVVKLLDELHQRDPVFAEQIEPLAEGLAEVYFTDRYPGFDLEDADWAELRNKVREVASALSKVKGRISSSPSNP